MFVDTKLFCLVDGSFVPRLRGVRVVFYRPGSLACPSFCGVGGLFFRFFDGEFDPGSGRTLAACLTHASRTMMPSLLGGLVANG